jgi:hypothetical protein
MKTQDEEITHLPVCSCGTCLKLRLSASNFTKFPYSKNLGTTYKKEFCWKNRENVKSVTYLRSKHSAFDNTHKEHLTSGLISTQKFDFKPFKMEIDTPKEGSSVVHSLPFFGRSTYQCAFPNWGCAKPMNQSANDHYTINIPLRGKSNYAENYVKFEDNDFKPNSSTGFRKGTLDFLGKFSDYTTTRYNYRGISENEKKFYLNKQKYKKNEIEKSSLIPAAIPKSNFATTYSLSFHNTKNNQKCALKEYLKNKKNQKIE